MIKYEKKLKSNQIKKLPILNATIIHINLYTRPLKEAIYSVDSGLFPANKCINM